MRCGCCRLKRLWPLRMTNRMPLQRSSCRFEVCCRRGWMTGNLVLRFRGSKFWDIPDDSKSLAFAPLPGGLDRAPSTIRRSIYQVFIDANERFLRFLDAQSNRSTWSSCRLPAGGWWAMSHQQSQGGQNHPWNVWFKGTPRVETTAFTFNFWVSSKIFHHQSRGTGLVTPGSWGQSEVLQNLWMLIAFFCQQTVYLACLVSESLARLGCQHKVLESAMKVS